MRLRILYIRLRRLVCLAPSSYSSSFFLPLSRVLRIIRLLSRWYLSSVYVSSSY